MKPVVIFGTGAFAEILHFYFTHDTDRKVAAFTVDAGYIREKTFCRLPVAPYETITSEFPPDTYDLCLAIGYRKEGRFSDMLNTRINKYNDALNKKYGLASYISSKATIWHRELIGKHCIIMEGNTLQPFVRIGNNVTLFGNNGFGHHAVVEDHVFISGESVISGQTVVGEGSFISMGAVTRNDIKIGKRSFIGMGAVVTHDVPDEGVCTAAPAKLRKIKSRKVYT